MANLCKSDDLVLILSGSDVNDRQISDLSLPTSSVTSLTIAKLISAKLDSSSFNVILFGFVSSEKKIDDLLILTEIVRLLKPSGHFYFHKSGSDDCVMAKFVQSLKFAGFIQIQETPDQISATKPNYETGSGFHVATKQPVQATSSAIPATTSDVRSAWERLTDDVVDDDLINTDDLLTEDDLRKPDPESLRVCGSTGKRKACANCSCGLAEELDQEAIQQRSQNAKSSCGSCYLGDAFRCASCPYLGMPAFKPGEKVVLDNLSDL